jgi:hypothetical protein
MDHLFLNKGKFTRFSRHREGPRAKPLMARGGPADLASHRHNDC